MKDFFEDLGKRLEVTAQTVTSRAGEAIEIQRLKGQIRDLARRNAVDLMELGRTIYDRYKAGDQVEEDAKILCQAVSDRKTKMEAYEKKIAIIRGASECMNCGKMVAKDMSYCPYCGEKAPEVQPDEESGNEEDQSDAVEKAGEKVHEAAKKAAQTARKAAEKTGKAAEKAADKAEEVAEKAADAITKTVNKIAD